MCDKNRTQYPALRPVIVEYMWHRSYLTAMLGGSVRAILHDAISRHSEAAVEHRAPGPVTDRQHIVIPEYVNFLDLIMRAYRSQVEWRDVVHSPMSAFPYLECDRSIALSSQVGAT